MFKTPTDRLRRARGNLKRERARMPVIKDISKLRAGFRARVEAWLNDIAAECNSTSGPLAGLEFVILETLRPFERSDELYRQGRAYQNGAWVVVDRSKVVTNAPGGSSFHNYGEALDGAFKRKGKEFSWAFDRDPVIMAAMRRAAELAKRHGITWGGNFVKFVDLPHWQNADFTISELRAAMPHGYRA